MSMAAHAPALTQLPEQDVILFPFLEEVNMATATWITELLEQEQIPYTETHHPAAFTAQAVAQQEHVSGHRVAKVVVVLAVGRPIALVLPASRQVDLDQVRELLGVDEVRLATEDEIGRFFPDCERGAIPALRHWPSVDVLMDTAMIVSGDILIQAGTHCDAVRMHFEDWMRLVNPYVGSFTRAGNLNRRDAEEEHYDHGGFD